MCLTLLILYEDDTVVPTDEEVGLQQARLALMVAEQRYATKASP